MTSKFWQDDVLEDVSVVLDRLGLQASLGQYLQIRLRILGQGWYGDLYLQLQQLIAFLIPYISSCFFAPPFDLVPFLPSLLKAQLSKAFAVSADMNVEFGPFAVAGKRVLPMKYLPQCPFWVRRTSK